MKRVNMSYNYEPGADRRTNRRARRGARRMENGKFVRPRQASAMEVVEAVKAAREKAASAAAAGAKTPLELAIRQSTEYGKVNSEAIDEVATALDETDGRIDDIEEALDANGIGRDDFAGGRFKVPMTDFHMDTASIVVDMALAMSQSFVIAPVDAPTTTSSLLSLATRTGKSEIVYGTLDTDISAAESKTFKGADVLDISCRFRIYTADSSVYFEFRTSRLKGWTQSGTRPELALSGTDVTVSEATLAALFGLTVGTANTQAKLVNATVRTELKGVIVNSITPAKIIDVFANLKVAEYGGTAYGAFKLLLGDKVSALFGAQSAGLTSVLK